MTSRKHNGNNNIEEYKEKISRNMKLIKDDCEIGEKKLILVEGKDDVCFFHALLKELQIKHVEVRSYNGKSGFKDKFTAIKKMRGFSLVKTLTLTRDADNNVDSAFMSIKNAVESQGLTAPSEPGKFSTQGNLRIGIFIFPNNKDGGALEDLCLKTVNDTNEMECVNSFIDCTNQLHKQSHNCQAKAKVQVFLAAKATNRCHPNSLGIGARTHCWNFKSKVMKDLKLFLGTLDKST